MTKQDLSKVFEESIAMEEKGYKFYRENAEKIKNSLGKKMLNRLAEDELTHIARIKDMYQHFTDGSAKAVNLRPVEDREHFEEIFGRMKKQMDEAVGEVSEVGVDDEEIINIALELESHARFYYEEASRKVKDEKVRKFYEMLATEERNHYDVLQKTHSYLENPALFFGMGGR
jgi:rubrerythrin